MAGTHKQARLLEPAHRAAEMRAIDRKHLKLLTSEPPHPAGNVCRGAVPGRGERISVRGQTRLAFGEVGQRTELNPFLQCFVAETREHVPDDRHANKGCCHSIEPHPQGEQKTAPCDVWGCCLRLLGFVYGHGVCSFPLLHNSESLPALARACEPTWETLPV